MTAPTSAGSDPAKVPEVFWSIPDEMTEDFSIPS